MLKKHHRVTNSKGTALHQIGAGSKLRARFTALDVRLHHIPLLVASLVCVPVLLILDVVLFQFTRPTCASCANLTEFLTTSSMTLAFMQNNKVLSNTLAFFKK